jgi:hypothetical protein
MSEREVALVMNIARDTLRDRYAHELQVGRATIKDELREWLRKAARKGNVSAMKFLYFIGDENAGPKQYEGKKERQTEAAKVAGVGTEWEADLMRVMPQPDDKPN